MAKTTLTRVNSHFSRLFKGVSASAAYKLLKTMLFIDYMAPPPSYDDAMASAPAPDRDATQIRR